MPPNGQATRVATRNRQEPRLLRNPVSFFISDKNCKSPHTMPCTGEKGRVGRGLTMYKLLPQGPALLAAWPRWESACAEGVLRGRRWSVAEGHSFHVKEADVHLGLDVNPLPDLERTERRERASRRPRLVRNHLPTHLLRHQQRRAPCRKPTERGRGPSTCRYASGCG